MEQDIGKFRTNTYDQFYTQPSVARDCVDTLLRVCPHVRSYTWVEPSAGTGVFLQCVPSAIGIDIDPKVPHIQRGDFLQWSPTTSTPIVLFGNPPFGRQASLAKSFIRHGATFADVMAFILPRSFLKPSMTNVFPPLFHCVHSVELPKNSFEVNGRPYDVPCVFQIWERKDVSRVLADKITPKGFQYTPHTNQPDLVIRRVGVYAGRCFLPGSQSPQSHYFLRLDPSYKNHLHSIIEKVNAHVFPSNTVGPRSLSKAEINQVMNDVLEHVVNS